MWLGTCDFSTERRSQDADEGEIFEDDFLLTNLSQLLWLS